MREIIARFVCVLAMGVVLSLSLQFASAHNPSPRAGEAAASPPAAAVPVQVEPAPVAAEPSRSPAKKPDVPAGPSRGRVVYQEQNCAACHAIAGEGNPRNPLDGVGKRLNRTELVEFITGTGSATEELAPAVVRRKARYRDLAPDDMKALVEYLTGL